MLPTMSNGEGAIRALEILPTGVALLDPQERVLEAMLQGWKRQQRSRHLKSETVERRLRLVNAVVRSIEKFPWNWTEADFESFSSECLDLGNKVSTLRGKQTEIAMFLDYITDVRYDWPAVCKRLFDVEPRQLCNEWNLVSHSSEYEGDPARRPLSYEELEAFFNCADSRVEQLRKRGKKGSLAAFRNSVFFKFLYCYGLRNREGRLAEFADFLINPDHRSYGEFGSLHVRWGKSANGGPPRRRLVFLVPQVDWIIDVMRQYADQVRPVYNPGNLAFIFLTERCTRLTTRRVDEAFAEILSEAGLPADLEPHCLRHTYATHLAEWGYDPLFIQHQMGHSYASTTAIYTHLSSDFKRKQLKKALRAAYGTFKA